MNDNLILVDFQDRQIGSCGKLETHEKHLLHRAFSVFVTDGEKLLIQRRAMHKYHSGGLWANACCSHPRDGETLLQAVHRRLSEEVGFDCGVTELFSFIYYAPYADGLAEYELDHVFFGIYRGPVRPDPQELDAWRWMKPRDLEADMRSFPDRYAAWFHIAAPRVLAYMAEHCGRQKGNEQDE